MRLVRFHPQPLDTRGSAGDPASEAARDSASVPASNLTGPNLPGNQPRVSPRLGVISTNGEGSSEGSDSTSGEGIVDVQRHEIRDQHNQPISTISQALHPAAIETVRNLTQQAPDLTFDEISYAAPVDDGSKLLCIGANYEKKYPVNASRKIQSPAQPVYFNKPPGILAAHGEPLLMPTASTQLDYEAEMAVVIGKPGHHIEPAVALEHVAGYTIMNDGSVRDWQRHSTAAGKNFYMAGSLGPWITTADEITAAMMITCRVNGELRQSSAVSEMIFGVEKLISYLSKIVPLTPGDVISTGSPEGTGGSHDPPKWLQPGDKVECELTDVGVLSNTVVAST